MEYRLTHSTQQNQPVDLTAELESLVQEAGIQSGLCIVQAVDTACAVVCGEAGIIAGFDLSNELGNLVPARRTYQAPKASPVHVAAGIKALLAGRALTLVIQNGKPVLNYGERIYLLELEYSTVRSCRVHLLNL